MTYQPTTNFVDSNGVDLGKKLVTKEYILEVYGSILESLGNSGLTVTPELWTWGSAANGRLGTNDTTPDKLTPVTTFAGGTNWKQVVAGGGYCVAIKTDGTLWTWGLASNGRLGTNDTTPDRLTPVTTFAGGTDWKSVSFGAAGQGHTTAIKTDGTLWIWGLNTSGQLGTNDTTQRNTPVTTFAGGTNWKQVSIQSNSTSAIKTDGTLWTWGNAGNGRLGTNDTTPNRLTPVTTFVGGSDWKFVHAGSNYMSAIKTDGTLWTWGAAANGKLGTNDDTPDRLTPVTTFAGGNDWKSVSISTFTSAIKTDGTLWTWGLNNFGQLGTNDDTPDRLTPVTTFAGGTNWKSVSVGTAYNIAIKTDGTLWVWGDGSNRLGTNDETPNRLTPVTTFAGGNNWKQVSSSENFRAAIQSTDYI